MATDELPEGFPRQTHAVVFALYPGDPNFYTVVERDSDSSGVPAGNEVVVAWLDPGVRHYVEYRNATESFSHYRFRHAGFGYDFGEPTAWYRARPEEFTGNIPNTPREPLLDLDLALDASDGTVDIVVNGGRTVKSISWDFATDDYPADATTSVDTDSEGDATIADAFTLDPGETGYVTVAFYDQVSSGGNLLGTLRSSITFSAGGGRVPTIEEDIDETNNQGELDLTVNDPDELVTQVRFRTKSGAAAWSAWTAESVPAPTYGTWTVDLDPKHISYIEYEVSYTLAGVSDVIQSAIAYDTDKIPELMSLVARQGSLSEDGVFRSVVIDYIGDADVGSIRFATSTATFPDRTTTQAGTVNAGRSDADVEVEDSAAVTNTVFISVLSYTASDGTGEESDLLYQVLHAGVAADGGDTVGLIVNPDFDIGDTDGAYWATESGSTGVAIAASPTVGAGVDFEFDADSETITIWQVSDDDDDITKSVTV